MAWHQRFFWLLLALLPTQLGYHFWPQWAMVLGRRVDYLAPTVYVTDVLILLTLLFWFIESQRSIRVYVLSIMGKRDISLKLFSLIRNTSTIILFLSFATINILFAHSIPVAIYKWIKIGEFILLVWYIVRTKPSLSAITSSLSIGVLYSSIIAITQFVLQHSIGGPLWWLGERTFYVDTPGIARFDLNFSLSPFHTSTPLSTGFSLFGLRPYATFPHPNVLGGFLAVVLPLVTLRYVRDLGNLGWKTKMYYGVVLLVGVIALFLTLSRSAIVVGVVGMGVNIWYLVCRKKSQSISTFILYTIPFILIMIAMIWTVSPVEESVVVRRELNAVAVKLWQTSPLLGVGLGNFLVRLPEALPTRTIYFLQPVHNIYLLLLSEVGVVGIGLIVLLIALQSQKWRVQSEKKIANSLFTFHLSLFTLLFLGLVDHYPLTLQQGQLLFTILAAESLAWLH